jgi:hypothetical protein
MVGYRAQMRIAGRHLRPGIADADHRPAVEDVRRQALILHPAAMHERVHAVAAEPLLRPEFSLAAGHFTPGRCVRYSQTTFAIAIFSSEGARESIGMTELPAAAEERGGAR